MQLPLAAAVALPNRCDQAVRREQRQKRTALSEVEPLASATMRLPITKKSIVPPIFVPLGTRL